MSKLRVAAYSVSLDGFGAGLDQSLENPLGVGGMNLHEWIFPTKIFQDMGGQPGGETGVDNDFAERSFENVGAWILGRNMFTPERGAWSMDWKGWWGDEPPYHVPVYVLTHHARPSLEMTGGTMFHFETGGIRAALDKARTSANGKDVRVGGGAATIRQYLQARLIDEMHLAVVPALLGAGEPLFAGIDLPALGYAVSAHAASPRATHVIISKN